MTGSPQTIFPPFSQTPREVSTYIPLHVFHFTDEETTNDSERLSNTLKDTLSILNKIFALIPLHYASRYQTLGSVADKQISHGISRHVCKRCFYGYEANNLKPQFPGLH